MRECKHHGSTLFGRQKHRDSYSWYCIACSAARSLRWRQRNKALAIEYKGGECVLCGYNKCHAAMHFHHLDPTKKDFDAFSAFKMERAIPELDKTILVCANCHMEVHQGLHEEFIATLT